MSVCGGKNKIFNDNGIINMKEEQHYDSDNITSNILLNDEKEEYNKYLCEPDRNNYEYMIDDKYIHCIKINESLCSDNSNVDQDNYEQDNYVFEKTDGVLIQTNLPEFNNNIKTHYIDKNKHCINLIETRLSRQGNKCNENRLSKRKDDKEFFKNKKIVLYKTEMCRSFIELGYCKYGERCQFGHDKSEIRKIQRHPKYKTEICKTFWNVGSCPYGSRCCFVHLENSKEEAQTKFKLVFGDPEPIQEDSDDILSLIDVNNGIKFKSTKIKPEVERIELFEHTFEDMLEARDLERDIFERDPRTMRKDYYLFDDRFKICENVVEIWKEDPILYIPNKNKL